MKRIKIDDKLIQKVEKFNEDLFNDKRSDFVLPKIRLEKLCNNLDDLNQKRYISKLYQEYETLLDLKPSKFANKKAEFDRIYTIDGVKETPSTKFGKKIVEALRYDEYRKSQYPKIINKLAWNIKTCFYCNYTGTLTIENKKNDYQTYYDLDHILPKSTYPFLATSFFNFIPVCASCNRSKSSKIIKGLNPFYEIGESDFDLKTIFKISKKSKLHFYVNNDKDKIEIEIADKINNIDRTEFDKIVDLRLLYSSQKHIAEEILWKKKIYSDSYINTLESNFSKLNLKPQQVKRILWGTDLDANNVDDIPLAKLKFDIIKDKD